MNYLIFFISPKGRAKFYSNFKKQQSVIIYFVYKIQPNFIIKESRTTNDLLHKQVYFIFSILGTLQKGCYCDIHICPFLCKVTPLI